jgi:hypothetical protein
MNSTFSSGMFFFTVVVEFMKKESWNKFLSISFIHPLILFHQYYVSIHQFLSISFARNFAHKTTIGIPDRYLKLIIMAFCLSQNLIYVDIYQKQNVSPKRRRFIKKIHAVIYKIV